MSSRQTPHSSDTILADSTASGPVTSMSASSQQPSSHESPRVLAGRYELSALLGVGGMGTVYRARDRELDDEVALKVLRPEVVATPGMLDRFRRELKLARRVTHRNVARAHDIGEDGEQRFLTMEFIDGEPLAQVLLRRQPLSCQRIIEVARAICDGLAAAHTVGVIHCDLKPENVLLAQDGRVVITDFGIARGVFDAGLRKTLGGVLGTPAYMAPEQVEGSRDLVPATDLYALGVMLYELFTGELPWQGDSVFAVAAARLHMAPPDPRLVRADLPEALAKLIQRCMARNPGDRFATAHELERALGTLKLDGLRTGPVPSVRATVASPRSDLMPGAKTVAVLPFRSLGPADDAYLADGLTEDLIDQLSMTAGLRVRPRGAVMHLAGGGDRDAREVGRQLGVQVVVEGSVRRAGERLRVSARLISVQDGFQLWAKRSDVNAADVLALSDELSLSIIQALTATTQPLQARAAPTDPRALDAYFRGRFEYHKFNVEALDRAVAYFDEARKLAPDEPMILAGYALASTRQWFFGTPGRSEAAREAAERAYALAPQRAEPLVALGSYHFFGGDVRRSVSLLRQAIQLNASIPDAHDLLGKILIETGPVRRGLEHFERSRVLDPAFRINEHNGARALALEGRWEEATRLLDRILATTESEGAWVHLVRLVGWRRDREMARKMLEHPAAQRVSFAAALLRFHADPRDDARPTSEFAPLFTGKHSTWRGRAIFDQHDCELSLILGQNDRALAALDRVVSDGLIDILWLDGCPLLDPLRGHPRFEQARSIVADRARQIRLAFGLPD